MRLKIFLIYSYDGHLVRQSGTVWHLGNFGIGHYAKHFCENIFEFGPVVPEEMPFKDISYLQLWLPFCLLELNHLGNLGRGHLEEHFCVIILNLDQWVKKIISYLELWQPSFSAEQNHLCNCNRRHFAEHF